MIAVAPTVLTLNECSMIADADSSVYSVGPPDSADAVDVVNEGSIIADADTAVNEGSAAWFHSRCSNDDAGNTYRTFHLTCTLLPDVVYLGRDNLLHVRSVAERRYR